MPDVSVCITTLNHSGYIEKCVCSVLAQKSKYTFEILVGDDCSVDDTRAILSRLSKEYQCIKLYFHEKRLGASENLKVLFAASSGRYIAQLDGDDYWLPEKLERQLSAIEKDDQASAVYCNAFIVNQKEEKIGIFNNFGEGKVLLCDLIKSGNFLSTSSMIFRSSLKSIMLGFEKEFVDFRTHVNLAANGHLIHLGEPMVVYRWLVEGGMTTLHKEKICLMFLDALEDAKSYGVNSKLIDACLFRLFRITFYDSVRSWDLSRIDRFQNELINRRKKLSISPLFRMYAKAILLSPWVIIKILSIKFGKEKTFFKV